jgi:hypothetical protein
MKPAILYFDRSTIDDQLNRVHQCGMRHEDKLVVLVDPVQGIDRVNTKLPVLVRLDFIENDVPCAGKGSLYRIEVGHELRVRHEFVGSLPKWEVPDVTATESLIRSARGVDVIERATEIVNGISDDERQAVWNWLAWAHDDDAIGQVGLRVHVNSVTSALRVGPQFGAQLINVAIGPMNL